jgi:hypothetical protein
LSFESIAKVGCHGLFFREYLLGSELAFDRRATMNMAAYHVGKLGECGEVMAPLSVCSPRRANNERNVEQLFVHRNNVRNCRGLSGDVSRFAKAVPVISTHDNECLV